MHVHEQGTIVEAGCDLSWLLLFGTAQVINNCWIQALPFVLDPNPALANSSSFIVSTVRNAKVKQIRSHLHCVTRDSNINFLPWLGNKLHSVTRDSTPALRLKEILACHVSVWEHLSKYEESFWPAYVWKSSITVLIAACMGFNSIILFETSM